MKVLKKVFWLMILIALISIPKVCFADEFQRETQETISEI